MKTDVQRIASYEARMQSSLVDPTVTAMVAQASANYAAYVQDFYPYQLQLRTILVEQGIKTYLFAAFEAMVGQMYRYYKVSGGNPQVADMTAILENWTDRGLDAPTAKLIALNLFNVVVP